MQKGVLGVGHSRESLGLGIPEVSWGWAFQVHGFSLGLGTPGIL